MGAQSEWSTGLGLCPRAAIAGGAGMWSWPCGPQLWPFSGLPHSFPCQDPEGETALRRVPSRDLGLFSPKGTCPPPGNSSPHFWALVGLRVSSDLSAQAPEH